MSSLFRKLFFAYVGVHLAILILLLLVIGLFGSQQERSVFQPQVWLIVIPGGLIASGATYFVFYRKLRPLAQLRQRAGQHGRGHYRSESRDLVRQPDRVFSRSVLSEAALYQDTLVMERTIDVDIRAVRRKLGSRADLVETVRGVGYRFRDPAA